MSKEVVKYDIKVEFSQAPDTTKLTKFTEEDVDKLLSVLPRTKLEQGRQVLLASDAKDLASEEYKKQLSIARLFASANKEKLGLGSDKDRESWALTQEKVVDAKKAELQAVLDVKLEEYKYQYYDDLFISARKQANKYEKQLDSEMQYAKYGR